MKRSADKRGAELLSAMANEKRLQILVLLLQREVAVREITEYIGLTQSAVSQHLKILRMSGLVNYRRSSQSIYYSAPSEAVRTILDAIAQIGLPLREDTERPSGVLGNG